MTSSKKKHLTFFRLSLFITVVLFIASLLVTTLSPVVRAKEESQMAPQEQAASWAYAQALNFCLHIKDPKETNSLYSMKINGNQIDANDVESGNWFQDERYTSGPSWFFKSLSKYTGSNYVRNDKAWGTHTASQVFYCDRSGSSSWVKDAATLWGYKSPTEMLCDFGAKRVSSNPGSSQDCVNGTGPFNVDFTFAKSFGGIPQTIANKLKSRGVNSTNDQLKMSDAAEYLYWYNVFRGGCGAEVTDKNYPDNDELFIKNIKTADGSGKVGNKNYYMKPVKGGPTNKSIKTKAYNSSGQEAQISCIEIAQAMASKADAYAKWIKEDTCEKKFSGNKSAIDQCKQGRSAKNADDCKNKFPDNDEAYKNCLAGMGKSDGTGDSATGTHDSDKQDEDINTCSDAIGAIGWMVCPVVNFMGKVIDGLYGIISDFLSLDHEIFQKDAANESWSAFRNIANILLIAAFLFVIYSHVTSLGISNYGIKRILPRLIMISVLINVSFIVCQFLIDMSNVLGGSLYGFINTLASGGADKTSFAERTAQVALAGGSTVAAGTFVAAEGSMLIANISLLGPIALGALIGLLLAFIILLGRNAGIVILAVISPLAFVALLLPNTEKLYHKWWKMFLSLLAVYPTIAVIFGMSKVAASIFIAKDDVTSQITALGVMFIPLLASPALLMGAMGAMGALGAKLQNMGMRSNAKLLAKTRENMGKTSIGYGIQQARLLREQERNRKMMGQFANATGARGFLYNTLGGRQASDRRSQIASKFETDQRNQQKDEAQTWLANNYSFTDIANAAVSGNIRDKKTGNLRNLTAMERAAAIDHAMSGGNSEQRFEILKATGDLGNNDSYTSKEVGYMRYLAASGARSRGDTDVYGASTLGRIEDGAFSTELAAKNGLIGAVASRLNNGEMSNETIASKSAGQSKIIKDAMEKLNDTAQERVRSNFNTFLQTERGQETPEATVANIMGFDASDPDRINKAADIKQEAVETANRANQIDIGVLQSQLVAAAEEAVKNNIDNAFNNQVQNRGGGRGSHSPGSGRRK